MRFVGCGTIRPTADSLSYSKVGHAF